MKGHCFNCAYLIDCDIEKCANKGTCPMFRKGIVTYGERLKAIGLTRWELNKYYSPKEIAIMLKKALGTNDIRVVRFKSRNGRIQYRYYVQYKKPL